MIVKRKKSNLSQLRCIDHQKSLTLIFAIRFPRRLICGCLAVLSIQCPTLFIHLSNQMQLGSLEQFSAFPLILKKLSIKCLKK